MEALRRRPEDKRPVASSDEEIPYNDLKNPRYRRPRRPLDF